MSSRTALLSLCGAGFICALLAAAAVSAQVTVASPVEIFPTDTDPVQVTALFQATATFQAGGRRIFIDPVNPASLYGLPQAELILITDIPDPVDPAYIAALRNVGAEIVAPASLQKTIANAKVLANGQSMSWAGWTITAVPMYGIRSAKPDGAPYHPKGRGNGYVLTYGGRNFYFAGETEATPEMSALKNIDVAFIPMDSPSSMSADEAADAVKAFKPKVVIPYHYGGQDIQQFANDLKGTGIEVRLLDWRPDYVPAQHP